MFESQSEITRFLWPVLCHSLWSVPLIGLFFGLRIESLSPSQGDSRMRFAILACIAAPFVIAVTIPALLSISLKDPESHFEIHAISSSIPRNAYIEQSLPRPVRVPSFRPIKSPHLITLESIVSEVVNLAVPSWIAGMAVLTVRLIAGTLLLRIWIRFGSADTKSQSIVNELSGRIGLRNPPAVRVSKTVSQPLVMGLFKPGIILPQRWSIEADEERLEAVLAHELAHILRRDLVNLLIERIAGIIWFFHPAMHRWIRQAALWREMAADRLATDVTGNPLALARALEMNATQVAALLRYTSFESMAITFASSRGRGVLGTRVEALLGPKGVCPVKISNKLRISYFVLSVAFAFMATELAAIGQELRPIERKSTGNSTPIKSDPFVKQVRSVTDPLPPGMISIGKMDRIGSKMIRNGDGSTPKPNQSFEVRFVSLCGEDLDVFLNANSDPIRTADHRNAWIVDSKSVMNAATSIRENLIHQAPLSSAANGERLHFKFTLPVTIVKFSPVRENGKVMAVKPMPQTTEFGLDFGLSGIRNPQSTRIELNGLETMPRTIERVTSPIKIENPKTRPTQVAETVVTSQSETFETTTDVPHGKSLVIKLGRTIEQTNDTAFVSLVRLANRKLWNREVYPYRTSQRYLIVTPTDLP